MGFSPIIKQKVLIASARHCCVCRRYKGVKIEVHHIEQEANGGSNSFENAIALCFDCHSDAGHYYDKHPRGTKFSKPELLEARDSWYEYVRNHPIIEKLIISNKLQTSYYVLHSFDILKSVFKNDFSSINKYRNRVYLSNNTISKQWSNLLKAHEIDYNYNFEQGLIFENKQFSTIEEYVQKYDNVKIIDKSGIDFPYFFAKRESSWSELIDLIYPNNFLKEISISGIEAKHFCTFLLQKNEDPCGGEDSPLGYTEYLNIAPLSFVFLGITNASKEPLKLNSLSTTDYNVSLKLPNFNLLPCEMVLIPISTAINLWNIDNNGYLIDNSKNGTNLFRVMNTNGFNSKEVKFFENKINPKTIIFNDNDGEYETEVHEFDFNNLYSINNSPWNCGSCPHLFFVNSEGQQEYKRELLVSFSNYTGEDSFEIPKDIHQIIIRELEDEITYIDKLYLNNKILIKFAIIKKGEKLVIDVKPYDKIKIVGRYEPFFKSLSQLNDMWYRNEIIKDSNAIINGI